MKFKKKKYNAENINFENDYISLENAKQVGIIHLVKTLDQRHLLVAETGVDKKQYHELLDLENRSMTEIEILNFSAAKLGEWYKISTKKREKGFMTCQERIELATKGLKEENKEMKEENKVMKENLEVLNEKFVKRDKEYENLNEKFVKRDKEYENLNEKFEKLTQELNELKKNNSNNSPNEGNGFEF